MYLLFSFLFFFSKNTIIHARYFFCKTFSSLILPFPLFLFSVAKNVDWKKGDDFYKSDSITMFNLISFFTEIEPVCENVCERCFALLCHSCDTQNTVLRISRMFLNV